MSFPVVKISFRIILESEAIDFIRLSHFGFCRVGRIGIPDFHEQLFAVGEPFVSLDLPFDICQLDGFSAFSVHKKDLGACFI